MGIDERFDTKLDKILEDVATIKVITQNHTEELSELKHKLVPVFFHFNGYQWATKAVLGMVAIGTLLVSALALLK